MNPPVEPAHALNRRLMLRGGAVVASATALAALTRPDTAVAAAGEAVTLGVDNTSTATTSITADVADQPALQLTNTGGATLTLTPAPAGWSGDLELGQLANTTAGPLVGVDMGDGVETLFLATTRDVDALPTTFSVGPTRIVDTRWANIPITIIATSDKALDSSHRLRAGGWIDIAIAPSGEGFEYSSVFLNVTAVKPAKDGFLAVYPPGDRPLASSVNCAAGETVSNAAFVSVVEVDGNYAVRLYASMTTHVTVDISGVIVSTDESITPIAASVHARRRRPSRRAFEGHVRKAIGTVAR